MKTLVPIPITVIEAVTSTITNDYPTINEAQTAKLFNKAIELWFFISNIHSSKAELKANGLFNTDNAYVNISTKLLKNYNLRLGGGKRIQYARLLSILADSNLIDINRRYSYSNSKKFTKSYRPNPFIKYDLTQTIELDISNFIKNSATREEIIAKYPKYAKLIKDLYTVKVDLKGFFNSIDDQIGTVYKYDAGKAKILTPKLAYEFKVRAIKMNLGIHFFSVSSTGRIYSSLANLPKVTLPYITLNGQTLIELDAANCQPLLLALLVNNPAFKADCENGTFYYKMAAALGIHKDEFKILSYAKILFNNRKIDEKMGKILDEVYQGLKDQINQFKCSSKSEASKMQETDLLWNKLQTLEASIFIKVANKQLAPVLTRHDAILCTPSQVESIREELINEFKKIGLNVTLKEKNYGKTNE